MENTEYFNKIEIEENEGIAKIKIDGTPIKALSSYVVQRGTDLVNLTINISVPPRNLRTTY